jgi:hypothetical protein
MHRMGTIENLNKAIIGKVKGIRRAIKLLEANGVPAVTVKTRLDDMHKAYMLTSVGILNRYFLFVQGTKGNDFFRQKDHFLSNFQRLIKRENYLAELAYLRGMLVERSPSKLRQKIINLMDSMQVSFSRCKPSTYVDCSACGTRMSVAPNMSMMLCVSCGVKERLQGMIFEDDQFFHQEGQRTKHGNYEPTKHCKLWVDCIQAREHKEIPAKVIEAVKREAQKDKVRFVRHLTCRQIRKYLQKTGYSSYNINTPLIRKLITGIMPPQLTDLEMRKIHIYFDRIIAIYAEIKPPNKTNTNYHPYYIMKILEQIIKNRKRRREMIVCIHLQSSETLIEHDLLWKKICARIDDFTYKPTDRFDYE